jgi:transcriptional regulator with XRE-family HTH domain
MDVRHILGERVRRCRMALGLNQTTFADKVGIPVPTLSSIEHGRQSIYVERVVQLAMSLAVSTDYLLGLADDPQASVAAAPQAAPSAARPREDAHDEKPTRQGRRGRQAAPVA